MNEIIEGKEQGNREKGKKSDRNRKMILIAVILLLIAGCAVLFLFLFLGGGGDFSSVPAVKIEIPEPKGVSDKEPFSLALQLSALGEDIYPAASFSIGFDTSKLEFLGIGEGNVTVRNPDTASGVSLPAWSVNKERANETGIINIMYLDMTGGKYAFSKDLLGERGVLLLLNFRLRGSVRKGDILELSLDDAVFAADEESRSLASNKGTLKTSNGRIVIGE